ncbi:D-alanyl-D-alanine carboxypeptidase PBP3 [Streptococcus equi subsp. zooepidemicus]|uniref:D-alanyl-D-alanine carboxypeptidase PBP3 n=1 Tax=Streptococcus equi TaxID=1336 RepID=UPI001E5F9770|nr:D-alanyl-D-alanine carboxypeptidase PBP3 [Streptococcus equi]MCD3395705.1 D-alanyl-D-alanine carboxypeptidase PBP3 [Streptococcus equi subsp. zooepidemicus]MCD3449430.1 D-alanyl-D-alanine carboxypeptidase PBP3 [Streptococcus equi subsp. zooepidemicus]HEL0002062.1 D-alanyl-D-alanine carboxypeptidase [Streptococcus equi subsp. zooepidemicus]HEL0622033.1 D-alanyl-D-alanine carboxypeptidase [Streptococcus equi subsp. zooepidemicus]HEL0671199.1 D-alanyl-D-alanine carboxypeptidase [Streptococcus 
MKKVLIALTILAISCLAYPAQADHYDISAKHAIAVELDSGKILYEKDADKTVSVASLSKVLTAYLVYKEVQEGKLKWDSSVTISNYPYELTTNYTISNVPLDARKYTVKELLKALIVTNANSPAIALAEKIGGTEAKFVDKMIAQLKDWGITGAKVVNASGLPNHILGEHIYPGSSLDDDNQFSAADLALVTSHLLKEFPEVLKLSSQAQAEFNHQQIFSYNYMLKGMPNYRDGVDGLFVSYSEKGGSSFLATSVENNMRIITVVLNADHAQDNDTAVFTATNQLLQYVLTHFKKVVVLEKGKPDQLKALPVLDSPQKKVQLVPKKKLTMIKALDDKSKTTFQVSDTKNPLVAPIQKGQTLAKATLNDHSLIGKGYLGQAPSVELVAQKKIPKSFFLKVWWNHFVRYVNQYL